MVVDSSESLLKSRQQRSWSGESHELQGEGHACQDEGHGHHEHFTNKGTLYRVSGHTKYLWNHNHQQACPNLLIFNLSGKLPSKATFSLSSFLRMYKEGSSTSCYLEELGEVIPGRVSSGVGAGASSAEGFRIIESSSLEETFKILKSNCVCFGTVTNGWEVQWFVKTKVSSCKKEAL